MRLADFDYHLPPELIAQKPLAERQASRMMVVDRKSSSFSDRHFVDLPQLLRPGDLVVLNNTRVFPARLLGQTETGATVEIFLVSEQEPGVWEALARPAKRLKSGKVITFNERLSAGVVEKTAEGRLIVRFDAKGDLDQIVDDIGRTPLPPYIKRDESEPDADRERYQTVFAKDRGAIAAPTAGLHFTPAILKAIDAIGVTVAEITLHVGYGTFEPVRVDDIAQHSVTAETYKIDATVTEQLNNAKAAGDRIVGVGTTTTRTLESNLTRFGAFTAGSHSADLTITPGYRFGAVHALLTNFHLPQSSLLILTSTFGGHELIMESYRHAVAAGYRFYSYGDCMFIV